MVERGLACASNVYQRQRDAGRDEDCGQHLPCHSQPGDAEKWQHIARQHRVSLDVAMVQEGGRRRAGRDQLTELLARLVKRAERADHKRLPRRGLVEALEKNQAVVELVKPAIRVTREVGIIGEFAAGECLLDGSARRLGPEARL
jgi:hypothetical protein